MQLSDEGHPERASRAILHTVAKLHYERDFSQVEIARQLGLSTATISRLLRRARLEGIVRIEVCDPAAPADIEARLVDHLRLKRAAVVDAAGASGRASLAQPVGVLLKQANLGAGSVVAIGWGRAVRDVVAAGLPRIPGVVTVPATGGMQQPAPHFQISEFVRLAAEQMGGLPRFIHVPYLPSAEVRAALFQDTATAEDLALWNCIDAALVGIGVPHDPEQGQERLHVTLGEREPTTAVGDVIRHYFDAAGKLVAWEGENRLVAVSPSQLRAVPLVIGVASSPAKAIAIRGAARAKLINALVTDMATARALLDAGDT